MASVQGIEVHMNQEQEPHSPLRISNNAASAPSPQSTDSALRFPTLSDNDLLGLESAPIMTTNNDDDTAPSSSDETPLYNVEGDVPEDDDIYDNEKLRPLIYGYLRKLGRNGKWQRRFFETDGESLSYYKSEKRTKQLATLDLKKVGVIAMSSDDPVGCTFNIQVSDRPYSLKAETKQTCIDWVITLNRVKEARMQVGGIQLVTPRFKASPHDYLSDDIRKENDVVAPRVVLDANRPRTRAVDDEQAWRNMVEDQVASKNSSSQQAYDMVALPLRHNLATWHKPRHTYYRFKHRVLKWARSIKKIAKDCSTPENQVILDRHLHPPGHDDVQTGASNSKDGPEMTGRSRQRSNFVPVDEDGEARQIS